jgi:ATP-dependent DNA ligase
MDFGKLYKITSGNKIYLWHIKVQKESNHIFEISSHGEENGKIVVHKKEITVAKGKKTLLEQAIQDAKRKYTNKVEKEGYIHEKSKLIDGNHVIIRPMLAHTFTFEALEKKGKTIKFPCFVQPKLDGIRCISYLKNGNVCMESRKGVEFNFMDNIRKELSKILHKIPNIYLDGELYTNKLPFEVISGLVRLKDQPTPIQTKNMDVLQYCVYDCILKDAPDTTFDIRNDTLKKLLGNTNKHAYKYVVPILTELIKSSDKIQEKHDKYVEQGYEGLMLRNILSKYEIDKRSKDLQKYKSFKEEEFRITGFHQGSGGDKGCIVWECVTKDGKAFSAEPVGTRQHRRKLFKNGTTYIGKWLTVKFFCYTKDGVPRFPKGKDVREDY